MTSREGGEVAGPGSMADVMANIETA
jgi:hypothetical protein